jgi:hypothetical protein
MLSQVVGILRSSSLTDCAPNEVSSSTKAVGYFNRFTVAISASPAMSAILDSFRADMRGNAESIQSMTVTLYPLIESALSLPGAAN